MPHIIFPKDYTIPRSDPDESYSAGQVVEKNQASCNFFFNLGAARYATPEEIKQSQSGKPAAKPAETKEPETGKKQQPGLKNKSQKAESGVSSQAAPASREPTATSLNDTKSQPLESTTPTK